ncbi:MAG: hypothetical protein WBA17_04850 [Saprospiraceae bacterium]
MLYTLITLVIALFLGMLFINIYFRAKVIRAYRRLVEGRVDFKPAHVFNRRLMEEEIIPRYPGQEENIRQFTRHLRNSINMATVLLLLITLFGGILMWYR